MKRGLASPPVTSALPTTRRLQLQLVQRRPGEVPEASGRPASPHSCRTSPASVSVLIACSSFAHCAPAAEQEVDTVRLAPGPSAPHGQSRNRRAAEHVSSASGDEDLRDNACHLLDRTGGAVDVRPPQPGRQQMTTTEDVERQITVTIIIAVEEPAPSWLPCSGSSVASRSRMIWRRRPADAPPGTHRRTESRSPPRCGSPCDSASGQGCGSTPADSASTLPASGAPIRALRCKLASQHRQHRIVPQFVVVVEVFIAQRDADHPLQHQRAGLRAPPVRASARR